MNTTLPVRTIAASLLGFTALLGVSHAHAQGMCPGEPLCRDVAKFTATITEFRVSPSTLGNKPANVTVRFTNKTSEPLILGYVAGTAAAFDDRGNKYEVQNSRTLQGIGLVERNRFDPKFTLGPGESSDARLEVNFFVNRNVIVGTAFDFEMSVREIDPQPGNQFRLGREHALSWQQLANGAGGRAPPAAAGPVAGPGVPAAAGAGAAGPVADPCAGIANCTASGPVLARVVGVTSGARKGNDHDVTVRVAFQNRGTSTMILNYKDDTGRMLDEHGEEYLVASVQGMPVSTPTRASSQFALPPGETRTAAFIFTRFVGRVPPGTVFSPALAVEQYELLASSQLQLQREYALGFRDLRAGAGAGAATDPVQAIRELRDLFRKKN